MLLNNIKHLFLLPLILVIGISCKENKKIKRYSTEETAEFNNNLIKANRGLLEADEDRIKAYIERRGWNMKVTETGLWHEIIRQGIGEKAKQGQVARLNFKVFLLDGTLCYSSDSVGALTIKIGYSDVETGLDQAVMMMKEGAKGRFILPPHLAHGLVGDDDKIPLRSTIVYHAELLQLIEY